MSALLDYNFSNIFSDFTSKCDSTQCCIRHFIPNSMLLCQMFDIGSYVVVVVLRHVYLHYVLDGVKFLAFIRQFTQNKINSDVKCLQAEGFRLSCLSDCFRRIKVYEIIYTHRIEVDLLRQLKVGLYLSFDNSCGLTDAKCITMLYFGHYQ